ncbi:hypothetical protein JRQ81_004445 [Phrynocephalus forsythii]|uniref:Ig-like domain-containing protein n=1 Tax=Phrynocephalus forsythii TaxID=171643 RepID=A0A9Q0XFA1_9SAUR|nr:hypothetical protein JRQ81_004445 [Phrynocephalus forsythii]
MPPAPTLSRDPEYPVYVQGERVTLFCSAPEGWDAIGYIFYQRQKSWRPWQLPDSRMGPYQKIIVSENTAGEYSCEYSVLLSGIEMVSNKSNPTSVTMTGHLRRPQVSVFPKRDVYSSGESIYLTCSAPESRSVSEIRFFNDMRLLQILRPSSHPAPFTIAHSLRLLPQDGGKYSCLYCIVESGREMTSPESNFISLLVMASCYHHPRDDNRHLASCSKARINGLHIQPFTVKGTLQHPNQHQLKSHY